MYERLLVAVDHSEVSGHDAPQMGEKLGHAPPISAERRLAARLTQCPDRWAI